MLVCSTFLCVPCIPLGPRLHLHRPWLSNVDISGGRLLVQSVELQQLVVVWLLLQVLNTSGGGLEISLQAEKERRTEQSW